MAGRLVSGIKSALGFGDDVPLALEESTVSADFKSIIREGSLGTIYKGMFMGTECAVKVFNCEVIQKDVLRKCDIVSLNLKHPNVVLVHGIWYGSPANTLPNKNPALVMELCSMSLDVYLRERVDKAEVAVFRLDKKLEILSGVTSGMIYLHSKGIIHGGLSARKVLLNFSGPSMDKTILAKVGGLCEMKLCSKDPVLRQKSGIMPPEVKKGGEDVELTEAVDVFSFGYLIAHVASCACPVPSAEAGGTEFKKLAQLMEGRNHQVFAPLMQRCLSEHPLARGKFEDVGKDLSVHQSKYGGKQAQMMEDQMPEGMDKTGEMVTRDSAVDEPKAQEAYASILPDDSVRISTDFFKSRKKLGKGAYAEVYRGEYKSMSCAVKVFKEDVLKKDSADEHKFLLPLVKHKNIVEMYGVWHDHHKTRIVASIVMELCDESLHDAIKKKALGREQKLLILRDITDGMACLHSLDIIHGNLHTGNVLLCHFDDEKVAKLADFDMNRYRDPTNDCCIPTKHANVHFYPPEVLDHKHPNKECPLTPKVDIFCYGELALEMAVGSYPTPDKRLKGQQTQTEVQRREKHLVKLKKDKENLVSLIERCLSDTPEDRPSSADIRSVIEGSLCTNGECPDLARLPTKTVESTMLGAQALEDAGSKRSTDTQEGKDLKSEYTQQSAYETDVDSLLPAQEATDVTANVKREDGAGSLDTRGHNENQWNPCDGPLPLALEVSQVTFDSSKEVGSGSFGTVYQGKYKEKKCAVKVFNIGTVRHLKDLQGESKLASIMQHHPNVVLIHGLWYSSAASFNNQPALVMEFCDTNLQVYLQEKFHRGDDESFSTATKLELLWDIAAGMAYLHSEQIVHGSLSANNVLLDYNGSKLVAKVGGFDQSRLLNLEAVNPGKRCDIMPPEVKDFQGPVKLTKAVDVFSFGCLIPHVASCVYPEPKSDPLMGTSEFKQRARYIKTKIHVFHPLMEGCLEETSKSRWSFGAVIGQLKIYLQKHTAQDQEEEDIKVQRQRSELLQCQRTRDNLQEELSAAKETYKEAQRMRDILAQEMETLERKSTKAGDDLKQMELRLQYLEEDKERYFSKTGSVDVVFESYEQVKEKNTSLYEQVQDLQSKLQKLRQDHAASEGKLEHYTQENDRLQNDMRRISSDKENLEQSLVSVEGTKEVIEQQMHDKETHIMELKWQLNEAKKRKNEMAAKHKDSEEWTLELKRKNQEMSDTNNQQKKDLETVRCKIVSLEGRLKSTTAHKDKAERERSKAEAKEAQSKAKFDEQLAELQKNNDVLQGQVVAVNLECKSQQEKLAEVTADLLECRDDLTAKLNDMSELEQSKKTLEEEKAARDKRVRDLTLKLEVREEDITKKEKEARRLERELDEAKVVIAEGETLAPQLTSRIEELEDENEDLKDQLNTSVEKEKEKEKEIEKIRESKRSVEHERDEKIVEVRDLKGNCDMLAFRIKELERKLRDVEVHKEELKRQHEEGLQHYQHMKTEKDGAVERAEDLQIQYNALHKDHETLRKDHSQALQKKTDVIRKLTDSEQKKVVEFAAAARKHASEISDLEALRQEKKSFEERLAAMSQNLKAKQKELSISANNMLTMRQSMEEFQVENERLKSNIQELEQTMMELKAHYEHVKRQHDDKAEKCQFLKDECDRFAQSKNELVIALRVMTVRSEEFERQHSAEAKNCQYMEKERDSASERAKELRKQRDELYRDHESLRKSLNADLQNKTDLIQKLREDKEDIRAKLAATTKELDNATLEVIALRKEKGHTEEHLEAMSQDLKSKEEEINTLVSKCTKLEAGIKELESLLAKTAAHNEELQIQCDEEAKRCHAMEDKCSSQAFSIQELEAKLEEEVAQKAELERQLDEKTEMCRQIESERAREFQRAEELQKQRDEMYKDHESLRKNLNADLQRKMDLIRELRENEQQMKTKLVDTAKNLDIASSERAALWQEKGHLEEHLEALSQNLKSAQDQLNVSANAKLELIQQHRTLQCEHDRLESSTRDLERELSEVVARKEALEEHYGEETKKCRCLEDKCNSQAFSIQELEAKLEKEGAQKGELEKQLDEKAEMCHQTESERAREFQRAEELQKQRDEMYRDHESLRKDLQRKMDLIREFKEKEQQMKAKLEAKKRDLEHSEKQLEDAKQCLKEKVEECKAFESTQLQLLCNMEDLKREKQQLAVQVMQKEAELATLEAERSALCAQLKDFAVIKAENESLKNDAEERAEMMRQCEEKSRRLAKREEHLNKEKMALTTERRLVMKQRKQMDTEFVRSRNLESIVKSFQESCAERAELRNASGREMSKSGSSEGSPDSSLLESPRGRGDLQNISAIEEGKREVEEALRQKEREIQHIQHQLDRARQDIKQIKDAERKVQDSSEEMHELAQTYFQSHRYPPFLYQLHQLQKHLHSSGVQGISTLGDGRTVEVTRVTNLRSFTPNESWCDEFRSLIDELKAMPSKQCQAYMLISFLHCGEVITFYRFHVALVPQVLSCERDLHPNELEGDAMPKAMLVYAQTELKSNNLKEFGITPHRKGVLLQPQCEGYVPELTRSQLLRKLKDTPAGLKHTEECLDANILHQLQRQYREFAKPRTAHRGPPMGVAMALI